MRGSRWRPSRRAFTAGLPPRRRRRPSAPVASAGLDTVVLSGGVFQNRLLLERTREALEAAGLRTLVPVALPPNDGGISYGQVAVAAARLART